LNQTPKKITVLGAGLVGSLLSILLARRGHKVSLYEKRPDLRVSQWEDGRTINLAMSERGWRALRLVGLEKAAKEFAIPMRGRMMHDPAGNLTFQPYGTNGECIYSVSRSLLNRMLMNLAEEEGGVDLYFEQKCTGVDLPNAAVQVTDLRTKSSTTVQADFMFGSDGAFSAIRTAMMRHNRFNYEQFFIEHGYKELTIPARSDGTWALEKHALHIWPRGHFMLIALPNPDGTFTCTLFFPFQGEPSFESIRTQEDLLRFFGQTFPDVLPLMPDLAEEYFSNPTASLVTVRCWPWVYPHKTVLIGDAAHAVVPFYGQGMNAGFEDCVVLDGLLAEYGDDWPGLLDAYQRSRKPDADAIAELALQNFVEMRDKVADPGFLLRKKIEAHIHRQHPDLWTPLYTMIAFTNTPYAEAQATGRQQDAIMDRIMALPDIEHTWQHLDYEPFLTQKEIENGKLTMENGGYANR
jgi:kynurenine 3-monooxygenase